jgi:hypothetical protein
MDRPDRWHRAAAVTLALAGLLLLGAAIVVLKESLPDLLGAQGEMMAGWAGLYVMTVSATSAAGGLLALLGARLLWRGNAAGVAVALLWVEGAALVGVIGAAADGNVLWAVRRIVLESADWSIAGRSLWVGGTSRRCGLDDVTSWIPVVAAVGAAMTACFLLTGRLATQPPPRAGGPSAPGPTAPGPTAERHTEGGTGPKEAPGDMNRPDAPVIRR